MTILDRIIERTREIVASRRRHVSVAELEQTELFSETRRPFGGAIAAIPLAIIAEVKRASPSKGIIREDFDPVAIARSYDESGAAAISVLTEPDFFQGSLDYLGHIRRETQAPLLRKDFIIDPYQVVEARSAGADAILLIATALDPSQLHELHEAAAEYGLDSLVEVYDARELDLLDVDRLQIVGANNRDLRTFEVDISRSLEILCVLPDHITTVSESGIETAHDLARLVEYGIDAALVGETFMRAPSPGDHLRRTLDELTTLLEQV